MASNHYELDLISLYSHADGASQPLVRFICSFGGKILPRPHDNQLRYVGGDTRIVAVHRHSTFPFLLIRLSELTGTTAVTLKYQLPNEDLDALITVSGDDDVEDMMEEYDRLSHAHKPTRLRLFLFPTETAVSRSSSVSSLLDGSVKRESWFVDALNGGLTLDRGRSEVSSEVPVGLDNLDRNRVASNNSVSVSDPGSSPFCSTSAIPKLPPVKTRPVNPVQAMEHVKAEMVNVAQPVGYSGSQMWRYPNPAVQPMYYMPGQPVNAAFQPVQIRASVIPQYPVMSGQVPVRFPGAGQVYGGM